MLFAKDNKVNSSKIYKLLKDVEREGEGDSPFIFDSDFSY